MRVLELCGDEEFKVRADSNPGISKLDGVLSTDFTYIFSQKRLKRRIELFFNVLNHDRVTSGEAYLNNFQELRVRKFGNHELVLFLHVFDPLITLALRINKKRPSLSSHADDTVLN